MANTGEMTADLREIIALDEGAAASLSYLGRTVAGTKGNLLAMASIDRDDGGIYEDGTFVATFVLADFTKTPEGTEIVSLNGTSYRILRVQVDDYQVGVALTFGPPNAQ